jgi:hypothetical protein
MLYYFTNSFPRVRKRGILFGVKFNVRICTFVGLLYQTVCSVYSTLYSYYAFEIVIVQDLAFQINMAFKDYVLGTVKVVLDF